MGRTNLKTARFDDLRGATRKRRLAWKPRSVLSASKRHLRDAFGSGEVREGAVRQNEVEGEHGPPPLSKLARGVRRSLGLTSDITLLIIASPFFALWFLYRILRQRQS
jgi:hypothetical protein